MAAAYAALVSLMNLIEQIQHHPRPPISLYKNQTQCLVENVGFLQDFLENYSHVRNKEANRLQSCIADAAFEAEDVIESHMVDQIHMQSTTHKEKIGSALDFYVGLQKVIREMDLIKKEAMEIKEKIGSVEYIQLHRRSSVPQAGSSRSPSKGQNIIVRSADVLIQLMDKLTGPESNLQVIPIVGMGGIGKTTLARNAYENLLIVKHFDSRAWVTISQEYSLKEILLELLSCQKNQENKENLSGKSEEELGVLLHKSLWGRRYLIIMDDMWSIEAWDEVKRFFPNDNNGTRVIITTRLSGIASHFRCAHGLEMNFLDEELSWNLLCKIVFGKDTCPLNQLEEIGKKIAQNCRGLPLSIVTIGGLLAKSKQIKEYWEEIADNLNSIVNLEDDERCLKLLYTSYNHLPIHLKPCFLYMGVFPEDSQICVSNLIKLWVAEGFLKPIIGKSLEEVAEEYLNDLVERNLILVLKRKSNGKIKSCIIHDLLRDLCLREAREDKFLYVFDNFPQGINTQRRLVIHGGTLKEENKYYLPPLQSASLTRSLICESAEVSLSRKFRLLRILKVSSYYCKEDNIFQQFNLRCLFVNRLTLSNHNRAPFDLFSSLIDLSRFLSPNLLWNLQTIILKDFEGTIEIGKMPLLRHVKFSYLYLQDPSSENQNGVDLRNLQTLSNVVNFRCSEEMVKMIPNIKKLKISYGNRFEGSSYFLNNLGRLHKLKSLDCFFDSSAKPSRSDLVENFTIPHSLKKLRLEGSNLHWEDISTKIGSLPLLQVLYLKNNSVIGPKWETVEGQFLSLKKLILAFQSDLECWITDSSHFPHLEYLVLRCLLNLKEIPLSIGKIPTLQSIKLAYCSNSAVLSAKEIAEEQEQLGNENFQVRVELSNNQLVESWASDNFQVEVSGDCTIQ